jgi:hypothetical protein
MGVGHGEAVGAPAIRASVRRVSIPTLAMLGAAFLYFLAIRSRAGEPRAALEKAADAAVAAICGPARKRRAAAR